MALRFTPEAFQDLYELDAYLVERSPQGLEKIAAALKSAFVQIQDFPNAGRPTTIQNIRILIEPKYKYIIPYSEKGEDIWILRVYHPKRAPLDLSGIYIP